MATAKRLFAEETPCGCDYTGDSMDHLAQALQGDWLPAEAYVQGKLALQFDLWIRPDDFDGSFKHKIVVLQRSPGVDLTALDGCPDITNPDDVEIYQVGTSVDCGERGQEGSMLVFVGQLSEDGEKMLAWAVRSCVWLAEFDELDGGGVDARDHGVPPLAFPMARLTRRWLVENREGIAPGGALPIGTDQLPDQMIEGGAEVLNEVPRR
jgi:hypothetical protein